MDWKAHSIFGGILSSLVILILIKPELPETITLIIFGFFSSLLPDIDHVNSKIRSIFDICAIVLGVALGIINNSIVMFFSVAGFYFILITLMKPKHRGITHTLFFAGVYSLVITFLFGTNLGLVGLTGYFSHLILDRHIKII